MKRPAGAAAEAHRPLPPDEAWRRLLPYLEPLPAELVPRRSALGRVLAAPLAATADTPPADVSAMDGYALAGPLADGDRRPVAGRIAAGDPPGRRLAAGTALKIMTGAPLPEGADRVVPFEATDRGAETVAVLRAPRTGAHVRRRGELVTAGAELLPAGAPLGAAALGLAAGHGHTELSVHRAPRVAVLATGDEVVPPDSKPGPGQLRDSNSGYLLAAGAALGLDFTPLGIAPDDPDLLRARVEEGLAGRDVLLLGGGVSAGELDYVEQVLAGLGFTPLVESVAVQPGKPLVVAVRPGGESGAAGSAGAAPQLVFGLPGNPASVMVDFLLFARPALRRLLGHPAAPFDGFLAAELAAAAPGTGDRHRFLPAALETRDGRLRARPLSPRGSHDLGAYARAGALLWLPAGAEPAAAGDPCRVLPLAPFSG